MQRASTRKSITPRKRPPRAGSSRQQDVEDWVVHEIQHALRLQAKREMVVLPVIVDGAFPEARTAQEEIAAIPDELAGLRSLQIHRLRPDPDFRPDMERLMMSVWKAIGSFGRV